MPQSLNGGVHRVSAISPVGNGADGEDQTAAGEPAGGKGPPTASTEMEANALDGNYGQETSLAQKGPIQYSMVTPRISLHIPINEAQLAYINLNLDAIKGIKKICPGSGGNGETFVSMTMNHRNQDDSICTKVYECIQKNYEYLHKADPTATIDLLCDKRKRMAASLSRLLNLPPSLPICLAFTITYRSATCTP